MLDEEGRKSLKEGIYMQTRKVTRDVISGVKGFKSIYLESVYKLLNTLPNPSPFQGEVRWGIGMKCVFYAMS